MWSWVIIGIFVSIGIFCRLDMYIKFDLWTKWRCVVLGHKTKLIDGIWSNEKVKCCKRCNLVLD